MAKRKLQSNYPTAFVPDELKNERTKKQNVLSICSMLSQANYGVGKWLVESYGSHPKQEDSVSCGVFCLKVRNFYDKIKHLILLSDIIAIYVQSKLNFDLLSK